MLDKLTTMPDMFGMEPLCTMIDLIIPCRYVFGSENINILTNGSFRNLYAAMVDRVTTSNHHALSEFLLQYTIYDQCKFYNQSLL